MTKPSFLKSISFGIYVIVKVVLTWCWEAIVILHFTSKWSCTDFLLRRYPITISTLLRLNYLFLYVAIKQFRNDLVVTGPREDLNEALYIVKSALAVVKYIEVLLFLKYVQWQASPSPSLQVLSRHKFCWTLLEYRVHVWSASFKHRCRDRHWAVEARPIDFT